MDLIPSVTDITWCTDLLRDVKLYEKPDKKRLVAVFFILNSSVTVRRSLDLTTLRSEEEKDIEVSMNCCITVRLSIEE